MEKRTIFIGDIHGCYKELKALIKKLQITENDIIYCVGDLINKWPKSYKVLNFFYKNREQYKSVLWNNELKFLKFCDQKFFENTKENNTFLSLKEKILQKEKLYLLDFLKSLPLYIETKDFILLHWGMIPWKTLAEHTAEEITNIRIWEWKPWYEFYEGTKKIIYGHNAIEWLQIRKQIIGLDSGCVYGNMLTAYILETWEIITQKAGKKYLKVSEDKHINLNFSTIFIQLFKKIIWK